MILLTVGTYPLPFERLVKAVDTAVMEGLIQEKVFAQIGSCRYTPRNMEYVRMMQKETFDSYCQKASSIIGHTGMGTISVALDYRKTLLGMPRLRKYGEAVNNHQVPIARKFEELGHILVAYQKEDLLDKIELMKLFIPRPRVNQAKDVTDRIARFLEELSGFEKSQYR